MVLRIRIEQNENRIRMLVMRYLTQMLGGIEGYAVVIFDGAPTPLNTVFNYKDTKAKCRHLKKLTCKGTLRQVFIRLYRLKIQSIHVRIFDQAL